MSGGISAYPQLVIGMDKSDEMIRYCRDHYSQEKELKGSAKNSTLIDFVEADAGDPATMKPSWEHRFDLLVSFLALHWVPDQRKALQNIGFCLQSGGFAVILMAYKQKAFNGSKFIRQVTMKYYDEMILFISWC